MTGYTGVRREGGGTYCNKSWSLSAIIVLITNLVLA